MNCGGEDVWWVKGMPKWGSKMGERRVGEWMKRCGWGGGRMNGG